MNDLTVYSDSYSKTSEILWQYCKDEPYINPADGAIADFNADNTNTTLLKIK